MGNYFTNRKHRNKSASGIEMAQFNSQYVRNYINKRTVLDDSDVSQIEDNDFYIMHLISSMKNIELAPSWFKKNICSLSFENKSPYLSCIISIDCLRKILELDCYVYINNTEAGINMLQFTTKNNIVILDPDILDQYRFFLAKHTIIHCYYPGISNITSITNYIAFVLEKNITDSITLSMTLKPSCNNLLQIRYEYRISLMALLKKCSEIEINSINLFKYIACCQEKYPYNTGYLNPFAVLNYKMNITFENEYNPNYKDELKRLSICEGANLEMLDQI